jgi:hypothetical protein
VRARIEQERDAAPPVESRASLRERLGVLFGAGLRPAFVAALVVAAVAVTAIVIYQRSRNRRGEVAVQPQARKEERTPQVAQGQPTPEEKKEIEGGGGESAPLVADNRTGPVSKKRAAAPRRVTRPENQVVKRVTPDGSAQFEEAAAASAAAGARGRAPEAAGDFDFEIARHAGRAELLLRSFRNVRPASATAGARSLDVSFEKEQARRLLYRNIALRRAAAERADPAASELLNTLEPILLDIANLSGRVRARDVQSIERRMEKKEIVAALQVRTLLASN